MNGKIDFINSVTKRVEILSGINIKYLDIIKNKINYSLGAKELISTMNKNKSICALCTGGFHYIANKVKIDLGFQHLQANTLEIKNDIITGKLLKPLFNENSKLEFLRYLSKIQHFRK